MTRKEFIGVLDAENYSYEIEGDKIVVTYKGGVYLGSITSIPPGVVFNNTGPINLESLTSLPSGVVFKNGGYVNLESLTSLPPGVGFKNGRYVNLESLIGGLSDKWKGNIKGIDNKRLLNLMISKGIFER